MFRICPVLMADVTPDAAPRSLAVDAVEAGASAAVSATTGAEDLG